MTTYVDVIQKAAPLGSAGYQIEVQIPGQLPVLLPKQAYFSLQPFQNPEGVPQGKHRVLFCQTSGERANLDPGMDVHVDLDFGLKPDPKTQATETAQPSAAAASPAVDSSPREPLPEGLHPAAESEESMEREIFSQHIERNEYSNFKLRSETRAIECLYAVIQRMTADQHTLVQGTLETPRRLMQEFKQMIETMGEAMKSFHSMIELQSVAMQAIQKQVEMARVPLPPPPPPDYVGLGKSLLEIIRDLGMKAMDTGYTRRPLLPRKEQELPEIHDAEVSDPIRPAPSKAAAAQEAPAPIEASSAPEGREKSESFDEMRRVLTRMSETNIARAFSGPEGFADFLADLRREIDEGRAQAGSHKTPPSDEPPSAAATASAIPVPAVPATTAAPPSSSTPSSPSSLTPRPESAQTASSLTQGLARSGSRPQHGSKRR